MQRFGASLDGVRFEFLIEMTIVILIIRWVLTIKGGGADKTTIDALHLLLRVIVLLPDTCKEKEICCLGFGALLKETYTPQHKRVP